MTAPPALPTLSTHAPTSAWLVIVLVAAFAVLGEVLLAAGMRRVGDLDAIRARFGLLRTIHVVTSDVVFLLGALCMALNFFAMLFALSITQLSLAGPAIGALTYIGNAFAAKIFLHEKVDQRRWLATLFVAIGVLLLR